MNIPVGKEGGEKGGGSKPVIPPEIRRLRGQYIAVALASSVLVLSMVLAFTNMVNWQSMCIGLDGLVDYIVSEGGELEESVQIEEIPLVADEEADPVTDILFPETSELAYETRYFTVTLDESGDAVAANTAHVATIDEATALAMGEEVAQGKARRGFVGDFRYAVTRLEGERTAVFLNVRAELASFWSFFSSSMMAGAAGVLMVLLISIPLSARAVRPVAESQAAQKRFVTDASHEIKTPLAVILSSADILEIERGESAWIDSIRKQVDRLDSLAGKLVLLSLVDEGRGELAKAPFDLAGLLSDKAEEFKAVALAQDRDIVLSAPPSLEYEGDRSRIDQLLGILLDNALKYSTPGSDVRVSLFRPEGGSVSLRVSNRVDCIEPGPHDEFFRRFYRADGARSSTGGHGIGLAVARAIVESHGGYISANSSDGHSFEIEAVL
ncbi:MAG: HAMP domain-containing sensor histidine kinase [Berryella intestinalis]|uniref:sensor histidine kinase n=1 Tax=Berryella intestinalis TaxID=1531429 RepID=UPI002A4F6369|nr:HAMP domain-containing sensor histidine kinase [Berryella intestinalis]MDD7368598.1 HAMP domain-containing sensor histidine kinase [Berryella intestinalis]MDY3128679.1 HAMP domain-containing sensor histidine kinase [Berryella intestinalis]